MRNLALLAMIAIGVLGGSCTSPPPPSGKIATEITRDVAEGTWALTDSQNSLFNVVLLENGSAISNWSKGPEGAKGERGTWKVEDGVLVMNWSDGWMDVVQLGQIGFEKYSYAPRANRQGIPTSFGQAIKVLDGTAKWVGIWKTQSSDPKFKNQAFYICLQSNGSAVKSIDAINSGCWQQQQGGIGIYFSDGWFMQVTSQGDKFEARSWAPGAPRNGMPTGSAPLEQVLE